MKLWKYSGIYMMATGLFHLTVGFVSGWNTLTGIAQDGFINSLGSNTERGEFFWFMMTGILAVVLGLVMQWILNTQKIPLPAFIGWYFLAMWLVVILLNPASLGGWLLFVQSLIIIVGARKRPSLAAAA